LGQRRFLTNPLLRTLKPLEKPHVAKVVLRIKCKQFFKISKLGVSVDVLTPKALTGNFRQKVLSEAILN
jgi:hypothetical protein